MSALLNSQISMSMSRRITDTLLSTCKQNKNKNTNIQVIYI